MAESDRPALRQEGGLWCDEVLGRLPDLIEGSLDAVEQARVGAHLAACDVCTSFGGRYAEMIQRMRATLADAPEVSPDLSARLRDRLRRETVRS